MELPKNGLEYVLFFSNNTEFPKIISDSNAKNVNQFFRHLIVSTANTFFSTINHCSKTQSDPGDILKNVYLTIKLKENYNLKN